MGSFGGSITSALGDAGTSLANLPSDVYSQSGIGDIAAGLQSLFGGEQATVPTAESLVGPPSPYAAPNPMEGFLRGVTGQNIGGGADVLPPGAQAAGGLRELRATLHII